MSLRYVFLLNSHNLLSYKQPDIMNDHTNQYISKHTAHYIPFFEQYHEIIWWTFIACAVIAPLIYVIHLISYASIPSYRGKYNYVGKYESVVFKVISVFVGLIIFSAINLINKGEVTKYTMTHFAVLLAVGAVLFIAHIYLSLMFINVYYPRVLSKKLKKLRYKPRRHPATGNLMKLLSEEEEDKYLDEGMQAEENVFSIDYDVWIDEKTGKTIIEKYAGHLEASTCENCGFATMRLPQRRARRRRRRRQ